MTTTEEDNKVYFEKRVWPKIMPFSISSVIDDGRNEWKPLIDKDIPHMLYSIEKLEEAIPVLESKYKLIGAQMNDDVVMHAGKCICGQHIDQHFLIHNMQTNYAAWVGNDCIYRFNGKHIDKTTHANNKHITNLLYDIRRAGDAGRKLKLLAENNISTNEVEETDDFDDLSDNDTIDAVTQRDKQTPQSLMHELYKICRIPSEKQLNVLIQSASITNEDVDSVQTLRNKYKRLVTKREGEYYIRIDTVVDLQAVIALNTKLYSRYSKYIDTIDIHQLIKNQNNDNIKQDFLIGCRPIEHNKTYGMNLETLSWDLLSEKRCCEVCSSMFDVSMPIQAHLIKCRPCYMTEKVFSDVFPKLKVKVKKSSLEPIANTYTLASKLARGHGRCLVKNSYTFDEGSIQNEMVTCAVKCSICNDRYENVLASVKSLMEAESYACWKCSFKRYLNALGYSKRVDCPRQTVSPESKAQLPNLTYKFSNKVVVSYECKGCKEHVKKAVDAEWNVSYHKLCLTCFKSKRR